MTAQGWLAERGLAGECLRGLGQDIRGGAIARRGDHGGIVAQPGRGVAPLFDRVARGAARQLRVRKRRVDEPDEGVESGTFALIEVLGGERQDVERTGLLTRAEMGGELQHILFGQGTGAMRSRP